MTYRQQMHPAKVAAWQATKLIRSWPTGKCHSGAGDRVSDVWTLSDRSRCRPAPRQQAFEGHPPRTI